MLKLENALSAHPVRVKGDAKLIFLGIRIIPVSLNGPARIGLHEEATINVRSLRSSANVEKAAVQAIQVERFQSGFTNPALFQ